MKRMLITGAGGFLGSRAAAHFRETCLVTAPTHREMDITDEASVRQFFKEARPELVIHCAAVSDTGACQRHPEASRLVNLTGSEHIAKAAGDAGAKCLLCSSDQIYFGSTAAGAHTEDERLSPANVYGRQKLEAEERCLALNPDCVLLRLTWMYDPVSVNPGEHSDFFRTLLANLEAGRILAYPVHDLRGLTYAGDVVQNMEKAFSLPGGVYNFGSENDKNPYDTVREAFRSLGFSTPLLAPNEEAFRPNPRNISMSLAKLKRHGIDFPSTFQALTKHLAPFLKER